MSFKLDFIWGVATASFQIEGATDEDGRGESCWDIYCTMPEKIYGGHDGKVACDHYHRYKEDIKLMKELGIKAYRFSISWPRILPEGIGNINEKGVQFYSNLIDELLKNEIVPYITLFHWDYPEALQRKGAWSNEESSDWFAEYTQIVAEKFGDRVKHYFTFNEPQCFIGAGYVEGLHAPGHKASQKETLLMAHNVLLAHGKAVSILRKKIKDSKVGYAPTGNSYYPATDKKEDIEAAYKACFNIIDNWSFSIAWWSDPILLGEYPKEGVLLYKDNMPVVTDEEMKLISQPLDFYGQNVYQSRPVISDGEGGYKLLEFCSGYPRTAMGWPVTPQSLYWIPKFLYERYRCPIIITENGMACHDAVSLDDRVHDPNRIDYLKRYLMELERVTNEGVDICGYFYWSFMDNFEWTNGYDKRFGLVYIDYEGQERIPKDSFYVYQKLIRRNGAGY